MQRRTELVRVFGLEPDLLRHVSAADAAEARDRTVVESIVISPGKLVPPAVRSGPTDHGFLVLSGLMLRHIDVFGRRAVELLGDGDVLSPWRPEDTSSDVPTRESFRVVTETRLAVVDAHFVRDVSRWPGIMAELMSRLARRPTALAEQLAIAQLPRLDMRLLLLFWRLADRWGTVGPCGTTLRLRLSQETLGELVAAKRASVNVAMRALRERELVTNPSPGRWVLHGPPPVDWHATVSSALSSAAAELAGPPAR